MRYEETDKQIIFNVSKGKENYSQRNNEFKWAHPKNPKLYMDGLSMCNVTSMVMALDYVGYKFPKGKFSQPEDNLCNFIFTSKEIDKYYKERMPAMWEAYNRGDPNAYCPNLIHTVLAYATNLWLDTSAVTFRDAVPIQDILKEVVWYNRPVVMSGTFPYKYTNGTVGTIGHINCLVGAVYDKIKINKETKDDMPVFDPDFVIVDDPYGSYKENFKAGTGNDVQYSYIDFIKYYKTLGDMKFKMAHIFKNAAATI